MSVRLTKHTIHLSKPWHNRFITFLVDKFPSTLMPQISVCIIFCPFVPTNHSQSFLFLMTSISRIIFTVNFHTPGAPGDWTPEPPTFIWCSKPLGVCRSLQQLKNIAAAATELQPQLPTLKIRGPKLLGNVPFLPSTFYILPGYITPSGQEVNVPGKKNRRNPTKKFTHLPGTGGRARCRNSGWAFHFI